jgi:putative membrane protein
LASIDQVSPFNDEFAEAPIILTRAQASAIEARVAEIEARTGVELVAAVVGRSYAYPQLPWKAFALGASIAGLVVVLVDTLRPDWTSAHAALVHTVAILGVGAACAIVTVFVPAFARLFLRAPRRDLEVRRHAESLFVRHRLTNTHDRTGVLLLVSLFERKIEIVPDTGFQDRVSAADWHSVIARMSPKLRGRRPADALQEGLDAVEALLHAKGFGPRADDRNELPDRPIVERGHE